MLAGLVWAIVVAVMGVLAEHAGCVPLVVDQNPVGALRPDRAYEPFGVTVRVGVTGRGADTMAP